MGFGLTHLLMLIIIETELQVFQVNLYPYVSHLYILCRLKCTEEDDNKFLSAPSNYFQHISRLSGHLSLPCSDIFATLRNHTRYLGQELKKRKISNVWLFLKTQKKCDIMRYEALLFNNLSDTSVRDFCRAVEHLRYLFLLRPVYGRIFNRCVCYIPRSWENILGYSKPKA